jgi:gamma-glutamyltranspeptidase/glutathione hydrolase
VIRGARAAASDPHAAVAAQAALDAGGSAVDALIAGFLGAAGSAPGVLLAPAVALIAGFGAGARAFDGRALQPGKGAARPRGFVGDAPIPDGARVAVPRSLGMLMLLHSYRGRATLRDLAHAGVAAAQAAGAKDRAALLRSVGNAGLLALRSPEAIRALLAAGGPVAGGALTAADLEEATPAEADAVGTAVGEGLHVHAPSFSPAGEGDSDVIVACDGRGVLAALAYVPAGDDGIALPDLGLAMGRDAVPVRRGVTRVAPGTVLAMPAPVAVAVQAGGFAVAAGAPGLAAIDAAALGEVLRGALTEGALAGLRAGNGSGGGRAAVAVITDGRTARVVAG